MFVRSVLSLLLYLLTSCSQQDFKNTIHPTVEDKQLSAQLGRNHWKKTIPFNKFGFARSQQLIDSSSLIIKKVEGKYRLQTSGGGMAALISSDGYALTASHVVDGTSSLEALTTDHATQRLHLSASPKEGKQQSRTIGTVRLVEFPHSKKKIGQSSLKTISIIHRFPGQDLSLIKLPPSQAPYFEIGETPASGDWLFCSGNGMSGAPSPSAGPMIRIEKNGKSILMQAPATFGDSGSPTFNSQGQLVGILSRTAIGHPQTWKGLRIAQNVFCETLDNSKIEALISADRLKAKRP